jgi:NADH:ubiquinone oxidoreductase subunit F (NADH-binding)
MNSVIIEKIKKSGLTGRGGACFPTGQKWEMVAKSPEKERYLVCNASEGDPHCAKDKWLLENHLAEVIEGIKIAIGTIKPKKTYIYLAPHFKDFRTKIQEAIAGIPIEIFDKPDEEYAHGEETVALNAIEGKKLISRARPPYPTEKGLWGKPTLINNVETFYWISKIAKDEYQGEIFVSIYGKNLRPGQTSLGLEKPKIVVAKPEMLVSVILKRAGISDDIKLEIGGIHGKKGPLSQIDQTLEKTFACVYIMEGNNGNRD